MQTMERSRNQDIRRDAPFPCTGGRRPQADAGGRRLQAGADGSGLQADAGGRRLQAGAGRCAELRRSLNRPLALCCLVLVLLTAVLQSRSPSEPAIKAAAEDADGHYMTVEGTVKKKEVTASGYRIVLGEIAWPQSQAASSAYEKLKSRVAAGFPPGGLIAVYLSGGEDTFGTNLAGSGMAGSNLTVSGDPAAAPDSPAELYRRCRIGCQVTFRGKMAMPEHATNPGQFDSYDYFRARGIRLTMSQTVMKNCTEESRGDSYSRIWHMFLNALTDLRARLKRSAEAVFGPDDCALIDAMVLGDRSGLDLGTKRLFEEGGIMHILAVSSLHVTLLGAALYRFLRRRRRSFLTSALAAAALVLSYCLMTGSSISAQRAAVMFFFWLGGEVTGRRCDRLTSLAAAAAVIVLRHPYAVTDSGFLLSFGCILSLELLPGPVMRIFSIGPQSGAGAENPGSFSAAWRRFRAGSLAQSFASSAALQLGILPLQLLLYYQIVPWSILLNLIVLPSMSIFMVFGILGSAAGLLLVPFPGLLDILRALGMPCRILLRLYTALCRVLRMLPGSVIVVGKPALWQVIVYLSALCAVTVLADRRIKTLDREDRRRRRAARWRISLDMEENGRKRPLPAGRRHLTPAPVCAGGSAEGVSAGSARGGAEGISAGRARGSAEGVSAGSGRGSAEGISMSDAGGGPDGNVRPRLFIRLGFSLSVFLLCALLCRRDRPAFRFTCLDIGQGSCSLVEFGSCAMLFDAGSSSVDDVYRYRIEPMLKYYGIRRISLFFLSHGDQDHIDGAQQMLDAYRGSAGGGDCSGISVSRFLLPDLRTEKQSEAGSSLSEQADSSDGAGGLDRILSSAQARGIPVSLVREGSAVSMRRKNASLSLEVLSPSPGRLQGNANEDCTVVLLTYRPSSGRQIRILFMGDLEKKGEDSFIRAYRGDPRFAGPSAQADSRSRTVLVAGHHGSRNATSAALLALVQPDAAVISCGRNNRYGHPARAVLERLDEAGVPVFRTDLQGAVQLSA